MNKLRDICFVCQKEVAGGLATLNLEVHMLVCNSCLNSEEEKMKVKEYLDSLAEGFVCGCI